ncbi:MAG: DUF2268 domain-containing putative Zn-dependent protease [Sporolactobacillus sp.]
MKKHILDTFKLYTQLLLLPDAARAAFFDRHFLQPFAPVFARTGMPRSPEALSCLPLLGADTAAKEMLGRLKAADAWDHAEKTIADAAVAFQEVDMAVPEEITLGLFLGDPTKLVQSEGYTGIGSLPGYIQIVIAPNEHNMPKLPACIAHEYHHNVLFSHVTWNFIDVTLSQYLAVEGLAENFAAECYGDIAIGPWVTGVSARDVEKTRRIIGGKLNVRGFMNVRPYIFGDHPLVAEGKTLGIPYCGGYAAGFYAVRAYLSQTGRSVAEATRAFVSGEDFISQSGYFAT